MKHKKLTTFVITCGLIIMGLALQSTARAQSGARELPVVVTNTTDNPVPVAGGVAVTNSPTVKLDLEEHSPVSAGCHRSAL